MHARRTGVQQPSMHIKAPTTRLGHLQGEGGRLRIGWVSRPRKAQQSRAVINEDEVLTALRRQSGADVSVLRFRAQNLGRAIEEVHGLDILMGVHGAGGRKGPGTCH